MPPAAPATSSLSLALPCYNEADCLGETVPPLCAAFAAAGVDLELILVDNGSSDGTSQVIDELIERGLPVTKEVVAVNQGQGLGIRTGLAAATREYVGYVCADGQVAPNDVVRVFEAARDAETPVLAKARRRDRDDGWQRRIVSFVYNTLMTVLFFRIGSRDINGNPKILPVSAARSMELQSRDWFLEAEVMLKAAHLRLPIVEVGVDGLPRAGGKSHVRWATIVEFVGNILRYRFGGPWREWKSRHIRPQAARAEDPSPASSARSA
mgnify:CR=1 FL=1